MMKRSDRHSDTPTVPEQGAAQPSDANGSAWTVRLAMLSGSLLATTALPAMAQVGDFGLPSPYGQSYEPFGSPQITVGGLASRPQPQRLSPEFFPTPGGAQLPPPYPTPPPVYRPQAGYAYSDYYGSGQPHLSSPPLDYGVGIPVAPVRWPRAGGTFASPGRLAAPATGSVSTNFTNNAITDRVARHFESYLVKPRYNSRAAEIERDVNARAYPGFFWPYLTSPNASTTSSLDVTAIRPGVPRIVPQGSFEGYGSSAPAAPVRAAAQAQALRFVLDPTNPKPPPITKPHSRMEVGHMSTGMPVPASFGRIPIAADAGEPLVISSANAGIRKPRVAKPAEPPAPLPEPELTPAPEPAPKAAMAARQEPTTPQPAPDPAPQPPKVALPKASEADREPADAPAVRSQSTSKPEVAGPGPKPGEGAAAAQSAPKSDLPEPAPKSTQPAAQPTEDQIATADEDYRPDASIPFDGESRELSEAARADLMALVEKLRARENARVQLHAYAEGSAEDINRARRVSLSRAIEVRLFLIEQGVHSPRIDVRALGNTYESGNPNRVDIDIVP